VEEGRDVGGSGVLHVKMIFGRLSISTEGGTGGWWCGWRKGEEEEEEEEWVGLFMTMQP